VLNRRVDDRAPARTAERRRSTLWSRRQWWGLVFALPAVAFFAVFSVYPILSGFYLSLTDFTLLRPPEWVGVANYASLLGDPLFHNALSVTLVFVLGTTVPVWVLSLLAALLFFQRFRGRELLKAIFFLPVLPSLVVVSIVWRLMLHPNGVINDALAPIIGSRGMLWLHSTELAPLVMIAVQSWTIIPFFMLIWLAGLSGIPTELREAALIDGANPIQSFLRVELPLLRPTAVLVAAISTIQAFQGFILQFVLAVDQGGPADSTTTLALLVWKYGFQYFRMGEAAAMSVVLFVIILVITLIQLAVGRSEHYGVRS
jgi:multiple sugar transport system permease protein